MRLTEQQIIEHITESRIIAADPRLRVVCTYLGGHVPEGRMVQVSDRIRRVDGECARCGEPSSRLDIIRTP